MTLYFFKVNIAIAFFYAFYRLFLYRDTFFSWRRVTLLSSLAIAAIAPLLNVQNLITGFIPEKTINAYSAFLLPEITYSQASNLSTEGTLLPNVMCLLYGGVASLLLIRLFIQLVAIFRMRMLCPKKQIAGIDVFTLKRGESPFSFFHWIFIDPSSYSDNELQEILTHEQTHAAQGHSIDVLVSEIVCVCCWFNPFVWLLKKEIRTNLEYLADNRVLECGYDSKTYQYHLLSLSYPNAANTIYNSFNVLPLKKRIRMMNRKRTHKIKRTKYLLLLPLTVLLLFIGNIEVTGHPAKADNNHSSSADAPVFEVVEQMPEFPQNGVKGLMEYISKNIRYPEEAATSSIQGRVIVQFEVDTDGSIINIHLLRSITPALDEEAVRVISSMPKWRPGMQRGKAVKVKYTVPILFKLQ